MLESAAVTSACELAMSVVKDVCFCLCPVVLLRLDCGCSSGRSHWCYAECQDHDSARYGVLYESGGCVDGGHSLDGKLRVV